MDKNHKLCPSCEKYMHRQSKMCMACARRDPDWLQKIRKPKSKPSYPRTPEWCQAVSARMKGKKKHYPSASCRPEIAEKIRKAWTPAMKETARLRGLVNASNPDWRKMIGESVSGSKNPMWEHGRSQIPYAPGWGRVNRRMIQAKQRHLCGNCGEQKQLDTHHTDGSNTNR